MRQRRSERTLDVRTLAALWAALFALPGPAGGQISETGAAFLLLPIAARPVGLGGAVVADSLGSEAAAVANPAGLGRLTRSEGALNYGQDFLSRRFLATVAVPVRALGTFAVAASLTDYGAQEATSSPDAPTGTLYPRDVYYAASYGSTIGRRAAVGVTYRFIQNRLDCTGQCSDPTAPDPTALPRGSTSAIDFGVQYDLTGGLPLVVGAAIRNVGLRLQVLDREQADPLPTHASVGARFTVPDVGRYAKDTELRVSGEIATGVGSGRGGGAVRLGAEASYRGALFLRAGFVSTQGEADGPAVGVGYSGRRLGVDIARQLTGLSVDAGRPPTYIALRSWF
jgi:hypothetical protein